MARRKKQAEPLPTIRRVDDALWAEVEAVLSEFDPPARFGPGRVDQRKALDGVIYRMRSGVQWNYLPRDYIGHEAARRCGRGGAHSYRRRLHRDRFLAVCGR
jgi:transposase